MTDPDRPAEGRTTLLCSLLAVSIGLAILAAVAAMTWHPGDGLREMAAALGAAALVHLCAAFALDWTRRS